MNYLDPRCFQNTRLPMMITVCLLLSTAVCMEIGAAENEPSAGSKTTIQQMIQAQNEESRLLDQWILERSSAQGITSYRKGIELVSQQKKEGLSHIEDAMRQEFNSSVFTPLFLRYTGLVKAWRAYDREADFYERLIQAHPHSPQVQAAVAVRQASMARYQRLNNGLQTIQEAFKQDPNNIFVHTLKAALLSQMPGKGPQARKAFHKIQTLVEANDAQAVLVEFYQQHLQPIAGQSSQFARQSDVATPIDQHGQVDLQLKETAPKAWAAITRLNEQGQGNWHKAQALNALEQALKAQMSDPTAFGLIFARYRELAQEADRTPQALVVCEELANSHPDSAHTQAAFGYALAIAETQSIMNKGLKRIEQARSIDPNNFFIWTARNLHLARSQWNMQEVVNTLEQMKETHQFQIAALNTVLSHTAKPKAMGISAQSASVN